MLVRECMTRDPITVAPNTPVPVALRLMREKKVRRLPVLDSHGKLAGIVSDKDLLYASPSPATTLAVWEIPDLLAKIKVETVMARDVISVSEDTPLEEAARIMVDNRIGGLPVMQAQTLVGIITETDLFKVLLQLLGGRRPGVRVTATIPGVKGTLAKIAAAIFGAGGDIVGLGLSEAVEDNGNQWGKLTVKVQDVSPDTLVEAIRPVVTEILDVREM
ncbi:MAG: CBS domain-containing protein [Thermoflexales bacterium]|nr:CBS domain-containing protein [Thermoflexales bacterium]